MFYILIPYSIFGFNEPKSRYFETSDGVKIHYLDAGAGPVTVFVPDGLVTLGFWQTQIEHFSKNYRVIAMDPRSQGKSERLVR